MFENVEGIKTDEIISEVKAEEQPPKEKLIKRIWKQIKRPFGFIKRKTEKPRESLRAGRAGAMILEMVLAGQFWAFGPYETLLDKVPFVVCIVIAALIWTIFAELFNLVVKLIWGGGKRCKSYFFFSWLAVFGVNIMTNMGEAVAAALVTTFILVICVDIIGRVIWSLIRTKRFRQVFSYVALALAVAYAGIFGYCYHNDIFGESRVDFYNGINPVSASSMAGFPSYLEDGAFNVGTLSYGPGEEEDIRTDTVDFSVYSYLEDAGDPLTAMTRGVSDYDFCETPVKGQIWYPEGQEKCPVFFMVHGAHVSTAPSYLGYEYLGQYLASNGYVVVSVDENIINELHTENDLRAVLLLENMKAVLDLNKTSGNPLSGLIDPDRIAIGGHSRGGEMVATAYLFNDLDAYPEDGNIRFDYHFNITSIVAIAPVVDQYRPAGRSVEISDVNYLLIHGSNDQDVFIMMGEKQFNNVTFSGDTDDYYYKSEVYILGANHGQFNSEWGRYDSTSIGFLNTYNFLEEADQQLIAKAYIRTFLDSTLLEDTTYISLMSDVTGYEADLPDTVYITNFEDTNMVTICSFDDTVDIVNCGDGASVDVTGTDSWTIEPYVRGDGGEGEDYVLSCNWEEGSDPVIDISFDSVDISEGYLSFGIADMREDTEDVAEGLDYSVTLTDADGNQVTMDNPVFVYHSLAVQLYKDDVFFGTYEYKHQIQQVRITPDMFESAGFDLSSVTGIRITVDGTEAGEIIIDDISYGI